MPGTLDDHSSASRNPSSPTLNAITVTMTNAGGISTHDRWPRG